MNLLNMLLGSMTSQQSTENLSQKTGLSTAQILKIAAIALPILLKYMTKNAQSQDGAQSLLGALMQHKNQHSMAEQLGGADAEDGKKIIGHIFGENTDGVINQLAGETGADAGQISSLLSNMAPALMSALSAATDTASAQNQSGVDLSNGFDLSDLAGLFGGQSDSSDMLSSLLGGQQVDNSNNGSALLSTLMSFLG